VLLPASPNDPVFQARLAAFHQELALLGWIIGRNVGIDTRLATTNPAEIRRNATELVALAPDVILSTGDSTVPPLLQATRTVPIVFPVANDPIGARATSREGLGSPLGSLCSRKGEISLNNLADLLQAQGDLAGARPLFERALAIYEKTLGADHSNINRVRCNLSRLSLLVSGVRPDRAGRLGRDHAWTKDSARVTAGALDALGRAEEAQAMRERYGVMSSEDPKPS
jgi:tetratricopeptide (TPR) repeat protein